MIFTREDITRVGFALDGPFLRDKIETLSLWSNTNRSLGAATMSTTAQVHRCSNPSTTAKVHKSSNHVNYCPGTQVQQRQLLPRNTGAATHQLLHRYTGAATMSTTTQEHRCSNP